MAKVEDRDLGYTAVIKNVTALSSKSLVVGVLQNAGKEEDGTDLVDVAIWNEYGTRDGHIPARPFLSIATDENKAKWQKLTEGAANAVIDRKMPVDQALEIIGSQMTGDVQMVIGDKSKLKPNRPATIRAKSKKGKIGDAPLIDTGRLRQSIHFDIRKG